MPGSTTSAPLRRGRSRGTQLHLGHRYPAGATACRAELLLRALINSECSETQRRRKVSIETPPSFSFHVSRSKPGHSRETAFEVWELCAYRRACRPALSHHSRREKATTCVVARACHTAACDGDTIIACTSFSSSPIPQCLPLIQSKQCCRVSTVPELHRFHKRRTF